MTDAHCHVSCGDPSVREFLIGRDFFGTHPWETLVASPSVGSSVPLDRKALRRKLIENPRAGVGEIGLDRLKVRDIPPLMREVFIAQLKLALELHRPVVLHGAKCWGQVVSAIRTELSTFNFQLSTFLFHGFSRSDGLIPDIVKLNGFISVGPAVLNDHAVNYREHVKKIPIERLLIETDRVAPSVGSSVPLDRGHAGRVPLPGKDVSPLVGSSVPLDRPSIYDILARTAELRGISAAELEKITDENAEKFMGASL